MRILVTADTIGGVWTYAREVATTLIKSGHEVVLVSFGNIPTHEQTAWMDGLSRLDFHPTAFRLEWMQECEADLEESSALLARIIAETKPDLLHLNQYCYGALECDIPKIVVAHSDVISWWRAVHGTDPKQSDWIRRYYDVVSAGVHGADALVGVSQWMLQQIHEIYGAPRHSSVIHNGRTPTLFNAHLSKENSALSVGRLWDAGKQATLLLAHEPPLPVCIAGVDQHPETGESLGAAKIDSGRVARVFFKGHQNETQLRILYGRTGAYIVTSRYEPFGLAPLEAAFSRCALVVNDIPTMRELWNDAAVFFKANDPSALNASLERLAAEPELRATYASLAYARAKERYTAKRMTEEYLQLYSVLTQSGAAVA